MRLVPINMFKPSSIFSDGKKAVLLFRIYFVICISRLSLSYYLICSLKPCCNLLTKRWTLGSLVYDFILCFVTFPYSVRGHVWYLIVSIPDLCTSSLLCVLMSSHNVCFNWEHGKTIFHYPAYHSIRYAKLYLDITKASYIS